MPAPRTRTVRRLLAATALAVGVIAGTTAPASAATTATFAGGTLSVFGDNQPNSIVVSRNAAGQLLVNGGAVSVAGGTPTVANVTVIQAFGLLGDDEIRIDEANGALPRANFYGGSDNDTVTGGSGGDFLFGQAGNDTLLGKGGFDQMFGGTENDTLTGGDADDQVFGETGDDRMVWNPGDDTDLNEGGAGIDTVEVNGGNGAEQFTATANGVRLRFDRVTPAPFSIDIGTSENLTLHANGGDDSFSASTSSTTPVKITADGGTGNDTLRGSSGAELFLGGDGSDFVDGNSGDDVAFLGAGDDTFQWDPGDDSDVVEGQDGSDRLAFNASNANEIMEASANGGRVRFTRNVASIVMDLNDVETIAPRILGGTDTLLVGDLSGTDVTDVLPDLGGNDGQPDTVTATATNGDDVVLVTGGGDVSVTGLAARIVVSGGVAGSDRLAVNALSGDDVVEASGLGAAVLGLTARGGDGNDVLIGGAGNDTLLGEAGDDVLIGGPGTDVIDGGDGDDIEIQSAGADTVTSATTADAEWLAAHARPARGGGVVLAVGGKQHQLPRLDLGRLVVR